MPLLIVNVAAESHKRGLGEISPALPPRRSALRAVTEPGAVEGAPSFDEFVRVVEPTLRSVLVSRLGRDRGVIATAEALSWAWENWSRVQKLDRPVPFLSKVGTSRTRWRRKAPQGLLQVAVTEPSPFEPGLDAALANLSVRQRSCLVLVEGLGYSFAEAAELLAIRKATVQRHYERGLAKVRAELGVKGQGDDG